MRITNVGKSLLENETMVMGLSNDPGRTVAQRYTIQFAITKQSLRVIQQDGFHLLFISHAFQTWI